MKIDHIALYVRDLERTKMFYINYFGATSNEKYVNSKTGFQSYFLSFGEGCRLEIMVKPELSDSIHEEYFGYAHFAISVGNSENVDKITKQMKKDGVIIASGPRTTGDGYYESCVLDPEGNKIEITE